MSVKGQVRTDLRAWYHADHRRCAICWVAEPCDGRFRSELEMAHIVSRGIARSQADCPENILMLCSSCHGSQHVGHYRYRERRWPNITMAHLLRAKMDLDEFEPEVLAKLWGRMPGYVEQLARRTAMPLEILAERRMQYNKARRYGECRGI